MLLPGRAIFWSTTLATVMLAVWLVNEALAETSGNREPAWSVAFMNTQLTMGISGGTCEVTLAAISHVWLPGAKSVVEQPMRFGGPSAQMTPGGAWYD